MPEPDGEQREASFFSRFLDSGSLLPLILALSLSCHGFEFLTSWYGLESTDLSGARGPVFVLLSALMAGGLVLMYILRNQGAVRGMLGAQGLFLLVFTLYFPENSFFALMTVTAVVLPCALYVRFPVSLALSCLAAVAFSALKLACLPPGSSLFPEIGVAAFIPLLVAPIASVLGVYRSETARLNGALLEVIKVNLSYQDYTMNVEAQSMLNERLRLTRDIHDTVGYALTNVTMMMEAAQVMARNEPEKLPELLEATRLGAESALVQVRAILGDLRKKEILELSGPNAIIKMVKVFEFSTSIAASIDFGNFVWTLGEDSAFIVYHFIQESMLNAFRHGRAKRIDIQFWKSDDELQVSVRDDGVGAKVVTEGIGISGMRERLEKIGGRLDFRNVADGFCIAIHIPVSGG
jgi:signal transduction histidine kinase